ncbi:ABC transporter ATP-binding protein [Streptomyces sp. PRB2-1]|uniref:ABC transporter ATP-binding protein n=1 Tax=Actinacidiphila epipremni TaxID=2053013 RepID=A0ABX0ZKM8_9ACTN|nr:ABC transporter ATP-binding protein [Actinacidiphila epipremni]
MSGEPAFALRGVHAAAGGGFALRDISFALPTGYVMGLIGANGAGKTTTIRCLLGMRGIDSGEIELLGHRVPGPVALRQDVGVVLDRAYLVGDWRLAEVERTLRPFYDRWDGARYRRLLDEFGLDLRARVKDLSRGMTMKLTIAVALSHRARLLVLDEPTSGLDPVARDELAGIIGEFLLDEGHSVLFSTHITSDLDRIGDYVTLLHGGRVVRTGPKDEVVDAFRVVRAYRRSRCCWPRWSPSSRSWSPARRAWRRCTRCCRCRGGRWCSGTTPGRWRVSWPPSPRGRRWRCCSGWPRARRSAGAPW